MLDGRITGSKRSGRDAALIWLALLGLYLLFSDSLSPSECALGAACASLGTVWWWGVGRRGGMRFRFGGGALRPLPSAILGLPGRTLRVGLRLARSVAGPGASGPTGGAVSERPVSDVAWASPADPATEAATRAVGVLCASLAPDGYVLRLDGGHGRVILHDLDPHGSDGGRR